jgi:antitoxin HigA-1
MNDFKTIDSEALTGLQHGTSEADCCHSSQRQGYNTGDVVHPGVALCEDFLKPLSVTAYRLSKETFIPQTRISEIIKGNRRITADTALRFALFFGNTPKFWLELQNEYDLEVEIAEKKDEFALIKPLSNNQN